jgi:hypothetical protein
MAWSAIDLSALKPGFRFPIQQIRLDRGTIDAYLAAVEDDAPCYKEETALVPPLAMLALSMRGLTDLLAARPGAVHLSQRFTARQGIPVDTEVLAALVVQSRSERRGFAALNLSATVTRAGAPPQRHPDGTGEIVLEGALLLLVPLAARNAGDA